MGGNSISELFTGSIDEVRIWNKSLCQGEIVAMMNGEIATTATNLLANYHFNQGTAGSKNSTITNLTDVAGSAYTGTLTNFALSGGTSNWVSPGGVNTGSFVTVPGTISVSAYAVNPNLCSGATTPLYGTGAGAGRSYTWNPGALVGASVVVNPTTTTIYTVTGASSVACAVTQTISINVTTCSNTLIPHSYLTTSVSTDRLYNGVSGDIDGDGDKDILVIDEVGTCRKYLNNGSAMFTFGGNVFTSFFGPLALSDMDGDSDLDLVVGGGFNIANRLYTNNGTGTFTLSTSGFKTTSASADFLAIADYDGDGKNDVAFCTGYSGGSNYSELWRNLGSNTFTFVQNFNNTMPRSTIFSGDIDADGDKDLILSASSWNAEIYRNTGGTFTLTQTLGGYCGDAKLVDYNNDGKDDIVVTDTYNGWGTRVSINDGTGNFGTQTYLFAFTGSQMSRLADFDGDGLKDIALNGNPNGFFAKGSGCAYSFTTTLDRQANNGVLIEDFNADGKKDLFLMSRDKESSILLNYFTQLSPAITPSVTSVTTATRCGTGTLTLAAAANTGTLNWYNVSTGGTSLGTGTSFTTPSVSSSTLFYVATINTLGCSSTRSAVAVSINATPTISVNSGTICSGNSFTMVPTGANTYTFSNGTAIVSPATTTNYSVTGTGTNGCLSTAPGVSTVNVNTTPTIGVSSGSICAGNVFTMIPNGANTYTYSNGSATVSPTGNTSYSVTGTAANGCVGANTAVSNVTVVARPTVSVTSGAICPGGSFTMVASGASTYTYSSGSSVVSPATTTAYNITGTSAQGCVSSNTAVSNVTVNPSPVVSVNSGSICSGNSFTMVPSGANTYTVTGGLLVVSPNTTTSYSVTGTSSLGCISSNTAAGTVSVFSTPTIAVTGGSICAGQSFTMQPTGAASYTYAGGNAVVSPNATTTYSVAGSSTAGCVSAAINCSITVVANPTVSTVLSNTAICTGFSTTITANGASTYSWNTGSTNASVTVNPTLTTTYTVTGVSNACSNTRTVSVVVNQNPNVAITSTNVLCNGAGNGVAVAAGSGGTAPYTYSWSPATATTASVGSLTPGTYTCEITDANTCKKTQTVIITQPAAITSSVAGTSAPGCGLSNGSATVTASGGSGTLTYTWLPSGGNAAVGASLSAGSYTCVVTDVNNCTFSVTQTLTNPNGPTVTATSTNAGCASETNGVITLTVNGGTPAFTYSWIPNVSTSTVATGLGAGVYTVNVLDINNCLGTQVFTLTQFNNPTVTVSGSTAKLCAGESLTLTASGATTYSWSQGSNNASISITPSVTTAYTVIAIDGNGCKDTTVVNQVVDACTGINSNSPSANMISVFPNPNNGQFTIRTAQNISIRVLNELGQVVFATETAANGEEHVSLPQLANGLYLIEGRQGDRTFREKIIVAK